METGDFTVSDLEKDGVATRYRVTTNSGEKYSCYVTSTSGFVGFMYGGASVSDAVCNQKGKPVANPLLEAAGTLQTAIVRFNQDRRVTRAGSPVIVRDRKSTRPNSRH